MKTRIVIPLALMGLLSVGSAYATTNTQMKNLEVAAASGNTKDINKLNEEAESGSVGAQKFFRDHAALSYQPPQDDWSDEKSGGSLGSKHHSNDAEQKETKFQACVKAAEQGVSSAEYALGSDYRYGRGVSRNFVKATYWYEKAATQGNAYAENMLGLSYRHGLGIPQDIQKSAYWYEKAAEQGVSSAEYALGSDYYHGRGISQNLVKANYWFKKAAEQGNAQAETDLGSDYYHGRGVSQDTMTAMKWWKKAAAQGHKKIYSPGTAAWFDIAEAEGG